MYQHLLNPETHQHLSLGDGVNEPELPTCKKKYWVNGIKIIWHAVFKLECDSESVSHKCFILCSIYTLNFPPSAIIIKIWCSPLSDSWICYMLWIQNKWNLLLFIKVFSCNVGESQLHQSLIRTESAMRKEPKVILEFSSCIAKYFLFMGRWPEQNITALL